jgi:hypothetical protein
MTLRLIAVFMITALEGAAFAAPSAEDLFDQGKALFEKGAYASAVAKWTESYTLSKEPELLFMIAQALENDGQCAKALATYRRFVASAPRSEQRPLADEFIRELTPKCDVKAAPRRGATVETPVDHPRSDRNPVDDDNETHPAGLKIAGLAVIGAGVVSVVTGLYFGHRASSLGEEVTNACKSGCDWAVYGGKDAEGRRAETKQYVFAGIGATAIIAGGVMYWLASREQGPAPIAITSGRDGAMITWSGSW